MSNVEKKGRIPPFVGQASLVGSYYVAECTLCGWVGSSETLTDDCQCTQEFGDRYCLGDTDEIGTDRLLEIVQAMAQRFGESQQAHYRLIEHTNETEKYLDEAAELLDEIVQSGHAYRECTDKGSATGLRVAAVLGYVAQFQPESHQPDTDGNTVTRPADTDSSVALIEAADNELDTRRRAAERYRVLREHWVRIENGATVHRALGLDLWCDERRSASNDSVQS